LRGEAVVLPPKAEISYLEREAGNVAWLELSLMSYRWATEAVSNWTRFYASAVAGWIDPRV
jgi:hypothetical protein